MRWKVIAAQAILELRILNSHLNSIKKACDDIRNSLGTIERIGIDFNVSDEENVAGAILEVAEELRRDRLER